MKQEILDRIKALGGNTDNVKGHSLQEDLLSITFNTVLYLRPKDAPWAQEPVWGIEDFVQDNWELFKSDKEAFYAKIIDKYFRLTEEGQGQVFWTVQLFTPFKEGSEDFDEWNDWFEGEIADANLEEIHKIIDERKPDFIQVFHSYGYPDQYYICLSDPNPENPTLFGTDHERFFIEISNEGNLEDFLHQFMTKDELLEIIKNKIEK